MSLPYFASLAAIKAFWIPIMLAATLATQAGPAPRRQLLALAAGSVAGMVLVRFAIFPLWPPVGPLGLLPWLLIADAAVLWVAVTRVRGIGRPIIAGALLVANVLALSVRHAVPQLPSSLIVLALLAVLGLGVASRLPARTAGGGDRFLGLLAMAVAATAAAALYPSRTAVHGLSLIGALLGVGAGCWLKREAFEVGAASFALIALVTLMAAIVILTPAQTPALALALAASIAITPPVPPDWPHNGWPYRTVQAAILAIAVGGAVWLA